LFGQAITHGFGAENINAIAKIFNSRPLENNHV